MFSALADLPGALLRASVLLAAAAGAGIALAVAWSVLRHNRLPWADLRSPGPDEQGMNRLTQPALRGSLSSIQRQRILTRFLPALASATAALLVISTAIAPAAPAAQQGPETVDTQTVPRPEPVLSAAELATILKASALKHVERFAGRAWNNGNNRREEWLASDRTVKPGTVRAYAVLALADYGWSIKHWACLDRLWWHESGWSSTGGHPERAYGIPQAHPGSKMAIEGKDWKRNPETQVNWGLRYISERYGSPCEAWDAWSDRAARGYGWY